MAIKQQNNNDIAIRLEYAYCNDISSYNIDFETDIVELNFYENKNWEQFNFSLFSLITKETLEISKYGLLPKSLLEFSLSGNNNELTNEISKLINTKLIFKITYSSGLQKILGSIKKPCFLSIISEHDFLANNVFSVKTNQQFKYLKQKPSVNNNNNNKEWILATGKWNNKGVWDSSKLWKF